MTLQTAILINGILDLGVVLAVAATMLLPFTLDRGEHDASVHALAAPLRTSSPPSRRNQPAPSGSVIMKVAPPPGVG
jgi:hypothetical protein